MNAPTPHPTENPLLAMAGLSDRRAQPRLSAEMLGVDADATLAPGMAARLVNLSPGGALLEVEQWIRPGTISQLRLSRPSEGIGDGRVVLGGRVVRCWVDRLSPLRYKAVIWFGAPATGRPAPTADVSRSRDHDAISDDVEPAPRPEPAERPWSAPESLQPVGARRRTWY